MIKILKLIFPLLLFVLLLSTPHIVLSGATKGLSTWLNALIPALLPYMLFSNIMIKSGLASDMAKILTPITKLLKISPNAAYPILSGLFFGYPACAANLSLMLSDKQIDRDTASFCVCAFNNISPSYIIGFVCIGLLNKPTLVPIVLGVFYISLLLSTTAIRCLIYKNLVFNTTTACNTYISTKGLLNSSIKVALINIGLLGGYVIIFSIITEYIISLPINGTINICPFIEIAQGSVLICQSEYSTALKLLVLLPALSFGGISGIFQTFGVDTEGFIDIKKYIYSKLLSGIICLIITYLTVYVLKIPV